MCFIYFIYFECSQVEGRCTWTSTCSAHWRGDSVLEGSETEKDLWSQKEKLPQH